MPAETKVNASETPNPQSAHEGHVDVTTRNSQMSQNTNDPFAPKSLRLNQNFTDTAGVKKLLTTVRVGKPGKQDFGRVHPDPAYRLTPVAIIELKEDREVYLVPPEMAVELPGEFVVVTLYLVINRQGVLSLWPVKLPSPDGRHNEWHRSAAEAAERAMHRWLKVAANMSLGAYEMFEATGELPEPKWPDMPFEEILKIAFRGHIIDSPDHPLIKRLRGAA